MKITCFLSEILNTVTNCASCIIYFELHSKMQCIVKMHVFIVPSHPKNCDII